jgi:hypothetical protein
MKSIINMCLFWDPYKHVVIFDIFLEFWLFDYKE